MWGEQHSISLIGVHVGMAAATLDALEVNVPRITLRIHARVSANLLLFSHAMTTHRLRIRNTLSVVTGVKIEDVDVKHTVSPAAQGEEGNGTQPFDILLSIPHRNFEQQDQHARWLCAHLSSPITPVSIRLHRMFAQQVSAWPGFVAGNSLQISQREIMLFIGKPKGRSMMISHATIRFPHARRRRRLHTTTTTPTTTTSHDTARRPENQTSSFFVRSYDAVDNSDSMLAFYASSLNASGLGLFSARMSVISVRYDRSAYCTLDEDRMLVAMDTLLAPGIRASSRNMVRLSKAVALAPLHPTQGICSHQGTGGGGNMLVLKVEVVLFFSNTKTLTLSVSQLLLDAGVIQIVIQHTKKPSQSFVVFLDTLGFPSQGPEGHSDGVLLQSSSSSTNYTAIVCIVLGCVAGVCVLCAGLATAYQRHQRRQAAAAPTMTSSLPPRVVYTALSPIGCSCYHVVQAPMPDPAHDLA